MNSQSNAARLAADAIRQWIDLAPRQQRAQRTGLSYPSDNFVVIEGEMSVLLAVDFGVGLSPRAQFVAR
jgi:hypothetical protein